jgi:hypothetical protein
MFIARTARFWVSQSAIGLSHNVDSSLAAACGQNCQLAA